jgi:hypothetical protein
MIRTENKYLLTFFHTNEYGSTKDEFCWFRTEKEMKEYIEWYKVKFNNFKIMEAVKIIDAEDVNLD